MSCRNKPKERRERARKNQLNVLRGASTIQKSQHGWPRSQGPCSQSQGPFVVYDVYNYSKAQLDHLMISTYSKDEALSKFSLIGPKMFCILEKCGLMWPNFILRYNDLFKSAREWTAYGPDKPEKDLLLKFFHEIAGEDEQKLEEIIAAWNDDLNAAIKKTIRSFKKTPMFPPGSLLRWDGRHPLKTWSDSIWEPLKLHMNVGRRPNSFETPRDFWELEQFIDDSGSTSIVSASPQPVTPQPMDVKPFVTIYPGTIMFVTEECIAMGETPASFHWNRLVRVVTLDGPTSHKPVTAIIGYNALLPKKLLNGCVTVLRKPSELRKDCYPTFAFLEAPFARRYRQAIDAFENWPGNLPSYNKAEIKERQRIDVEQLGRTFLSFNKALVQGWNKEGKR